MRAEHDPPAKNKAPPTHPHAHLAGAQHAEGVGHHGGARAVVQRYLALPYLAQVRHEQLGGEAARPRVVEGHAGLEGGRGWVGRDAL